jgi:hypothetical protein
MGVDENSPGKEAEIHHQGLCARDGPGAALNGFAGLSAPCTEIYARRASATK